MADGDMRKRLRSKYMKKDGPTPKIVALCKEQGINPGDWAVYFGDIAPGVAKCTDCYERKNELCAGGKDPVTCIRDEDRPGMRLRGTR